MNVRNRYLWPLVVNHGSFLTDEDVSGIKLPALFNGADNDQLLPKEKFHEYEGLLEKSKVPHDFKVRVILQAYFLSSQMDFRVYYRFNETK